MYWTPKAANLALQAWHLFCLLAGMFLCGWQP